MLPQAEEYQEPRQSADPKAFRESLAPVPLDPRVPAFRAMKQKALSLGLSPCQHNSGRAGSSGGSECGEVDL